MGRLHSTFFSFLVLLAGGSLRSQAAPDANLASFGNSPRGSLRSVLRPAVEVNLPARAAGILTAVNIPEGELVKAGQSILSLDSDQERAELAAAEAAVRGAKAEMERAAAEYERVQQVRADNIYSDKQILEAKTFADLARSKHDQAVATAQIAKVRLDNREVVAPVSGYFLKKYKEVGEAVERYETVARLVDVTSLEMTVYCDSRYFSLFKTGQRVDVKVLKSAENEPVVSGTIIHTDPIIDPSSGTFRVKVRIEPSEQAVPGLSALLISPAAEPIRAIH